ncbi:hypothetical protein SteCoe_17813 [Stentor coeruleus]|uniref:RING-type domain-containing protein n=1 Tax=Stentor coeruleus TaxID=5963 RepID=A0A1R2BYF2_9CILI|nr:hypothetical protein SteCoe_17813 [Stentor coeruleus]
MSDKAVIECPICFEVFKDPRIFYCGHTICKSCIVKSIQNDIISCPICRKTFPMKSVNKLTKNYSLSNLIAEFLNIKAESKNFESLLSQNEDFKQQIKSLKNYLEISDSKLRIAENSLTKKKAENEKLYEKIRKLESVSKQDNKCKIHNSIIVKLEMQVDESKIKISRLLEIIRKYGLDNVDEMIEIRNEENITENFKESLKSKKNFNGSFMQDDESPKKILALQDNESNEKNFVSRAFRLPSLPGKRVGVNSRLIGSRLSFDEVLNMTDINIGNKN